MFIDDNGKNLCVYDIANGKEVCFTPKELDVLWKCNIVGVLGIWECSRIRRRK